MSLTRFGVDPWDLTTFDPATRRYGEGALIDPYSYG